MTVVPHCWKTGVSISATAHLAFVAANCAFIEYLPPQLCHERLRRELAHEELELRSDGTIPSRASPDWESNSIGTPSTATGWRDGDDWFRQRERWLAFAAVAVVPALVVIGPILTFLVMSLFRVENNQIVREVNLANYAEVFGNPTYRGLRGVALALRPGRRLHPAHRLPGGLVRLAPAGASAQHPAAADRVAALHELHRETLRVARGAGLNGLLNQALVGMGILDEPSKAFLYNQRAVLMTMTVIFLPFVILPVFISLERIPSRLLEASHDLGATPLRTFRRVVLPLSLPGTVAGALFVFVLAMGDFITPQMVGGTSGFTYGRLIWSQFGLAYNWPLGSAMAVLLATSRSSWRQATPRARSEFSRGALTRERVVEAVAGLLPRSAARPLLAGADQRPLLGRRPGRWADSVGQLFAGAVPHGLVRSGRH